MNLPYFIARRYLFAKKSHNVINIISLISAIGIMVGTAALIITLSIYNGFENFVAGMYGKYEADILISPKEGKTFTPDSTLIINLQENLAVSYICPIIQDNAFLNYDGRQGIGLIRGVDSIYQNAHKVETSITDGRFDLYDGEIPQAVVGAALARDMGIMPRFLDPLEIYYPDRNKKVTLMNPMAAINKTAVFPIGKISIDQKLDKSIVFIPFKEAQKLMCFKENEYSCLEVMLHQKGSLGSSSKDLQKELINKYGDKLKIQNRYQQNETVYKMMSYEKIAISMILIFIILIISFNVFGSLTMLILEKRKDIGTIKSIGADYKLIRNIFIVEGWMICLLGTIVGLIIGVGLSLIQQHIGILKMPGNFAIDAYPVIVKNYDILFSFISISLIGLIISSLPAIKILPNIYKNTQNE